jgi:hypothetical protein
MPRKTAPKPPPPTDAPVRRHSSKSPHCPCLRCQLARILEAEPTLAEAIGMVARQPELPFELPDPAPFLDSLQ